MPYVSDLLLQLHYDWLLLLLDFACGPPSHVMSLLHGSWGHVAVSVLLYLIHKIAKTLEGQ